MKQYFLWALVLVLFVAQTTQASEWHYQLKTILKPEKHHLSVDATIHLPSPTKKRTVSDFTFSLHPGLNAHSSTPGVHIQKEKPTQPVTKSGITLERYQITIPTELSSFTLHYAGAINHPLKQSGENYGRSFSETPGTISEEGVYLAGSTTWYPVFDKVDLVSFDLEVILPSGWESVSQGERRQHTSNDIQNVAQWHSPQKQEEIYLVAGRWTEYHQRAGEIETQVFLRKPDAALANQYLEVTAQYLEMYQNLLGPYPYKKFALVENFWETGYGMPSFTLLGSRILRMPFILHSSYPHEILHNWWGNGVYLEPTEGNWAEGLTTYLADHLIAEQRGSGVRSRRASLQKYTDYVSTGLDFPLNAFTQRDSAATEAVGYGKTLMLFHMLRLELGDETFIAALRAFYAQNRFSRSGFNQLNRVFSKAAGRDLSLFFDQWVNRMGAPQLSIKETKVQKVGKEYRLTITLEQGQKEAAYALEIPLAITLAGQDKLEKTSVSMDKKTLRFSLLFDKKPLWLKVDPQFDLFRRLHRDEIPTALSQSFGAKRLLIVLPSRAKGDLRGAYDELARTWAKETNRDIEIRWDIDLAALPKDRSIWLFGWNNGFRKIFSKTLKKFGATINRKTATLGSKKVPRKNNSVVVINRQRLNPDESIALLAVDTVVALPGLARKLPHYGRYSYLAFSGAEPSNFLKGVWPVTGSPLSRKLSPTQNLPAKSLPSEPLAKLPVLFSEKRMMSDIRFLADQKMKGRGFGSAELDQAADYIRDEFKKAGLLPLHNGETGYFQSWEQSGGEPAKKVLLKNIVAIIPGNNAKYAKESVVIGAHYDHLGLGWPDAHTGDTGKIHPGADDNASGVSVLLELARTLGKSFRPERTLIFVAFSAEEMGTLGAQHYLKTIKRYPPDQIMAMLNMDTVGRLGNQKLTVFGGHSSPQWTHIFRGIGFVTGISVDVGSSTFNASDQIRFHEQGIPAVQLFAGANPDFHRPSDTPDKIDSAGLVKVAQVMKEAISYLSGRPNALTSTVAPAGSNRTKKQMTKPRKVGIGTIPDFKYEGEGVRISGVSSGSPAEKAGLIEGDVLFWIGNNFIKDLRGFSEALKKLKADIKVPLTLLRGEHEMKLWVVPALR